MENEKKMERQPVASEAEPAIKILSYEENYDTDYGKSLIQYQVGEDYVSFTFSDVPAEPGNLHLMEEDVRSVLAEEERGPLWTDLSETVLNEILESNFNMRFIENDDDDWNTEKAEEVLREVKERKLYHVITRGEDSYLTIYAGAMCDVNWYNHPVYSKPYLS